MPITKEPRRVTTSPGMVRGVVRMLFNILDVLSLCYLFVGNALRDMSRVAESDF